MNKIIDTLDNFDLELSSALIVFAIIMAAWIGIESLEFLSPYENCVDFGNRETEYGFCTDYGERLYSLMQYEENRFEQPTRIVTFELLYYSHLVFGDYRVAPFISSIILLVLVFFLTKEVTGRNVGGLVAVPLIMASSIFWKYDITITYPNFWVTLLILAIYLSFKKWQFSMIPFIVSIPAKIINVLNIIPMILFFRFSDSPNSLKIIKFYAIAIGIFVIAVMSLYFSSAYYQNYINEFIQYQFQFEPTEFLWTLGMWSVEFAQDKQTLFAIFMVIPSLFILTLAKIKNSKAVMLFVIASIIQPAIIQGFTKFTNEDYRFLPLVIFVYIGVALIIFNVKPLSAEFQKRFSSRRSS